MQLNILFCGTFGVFVELFFFYIFVEGVCMGERAYICVCRYIAFIKRGGTSVYFASDTKMSPVNALPVMSSS